MTKTFGKMEALIRENAARNEMTTIEVYGEGYRIRPRGYADGGRLRYDVMSLDRRAGEYRVFGQAADPCEALEMIHEHRANV